MRFTDVRPTVRRTGCTVHELLRIVLFVFAVVLRFLDGCIASIPSTSPTRATGSVDHESGVTPTTRRTSTSLQLDASYASAMPTIGTDAAAAAATVAADYFRQLANVDDGGSRRAKTRRSCRSWLAGHIEGCLVGYERLLMSNSAYSAEGVSELMASAAGRSVLRHLCSEYAQTMQCLHERLTKCPPDEVHLYLIAYRLGHVRTSMEQTCIDLNIGGRSTTTTVVLPTTTLTPTATSGLPDREPSSSVEPIKSRPGTDSSASSTTPETDSGAAADVGRVDSSTGLAKPRTEPSLSGPDDEIRPCWFDGSAAPSSLEAERVTPSPLLLRLSSPPSSSPAPISYAAVAVDERCRETPSSPLQRTAVAAATIRVRPSPSLTMTMCVVVVLAGHLPRRFVRRPHELR